MRSGYARGSLLITAIAALILAGCTQRPWLTCADLTSADSSAIASYGFARDDSLRAALQSMCGMLGALRDSSRQSSAEQDTVAIAPGLSQDHVQLSQSVHRLLQEHAVPYGSSLDTLVDSLWAQPLAAQQDAIALYELRFGAAREELQTWARQQRASPQLAAVQIGIGVLDSLHVLLHQSVQAETSLAPESDSLATTLARLVAIRSLRAATLQQELEISSSTFAPLLEEEVRLRTRALAWQLSLAGDLIGSTDALIQNLASQAAQNAPLDAELLLEDATNAIAAISTVLTRNIASLLDASTRVPTPDADSLIQLTAAIQDDLVQARRGVDLLQRAIQTRELATEDSQLQLLADATALYSASLSDIQLLNESTAAQLQTNLQHVGLRIVVALVLLFASLAFVRLLMWLLFSVSERSASRRLFYKRLIPVARLIVITITTYVILAYVFQLDQRSLLAAGAAIGVAVGFAAQGIVKNIFGGIVIIFDKPFQVGDKIRVGGTYGEVTSIGLQATRIVTPDDNEVTVPNAQVIDSQVANANTGALDCQVVIELFVPGWADMAKAKSIAYSAAADSRYVFMGKPIVVNVTDVFKETFLTRLSVKAYVLDTRHEFAFSSDVTETAKAEFRKQGILGRPYWPHAARPEE